MNAVETDDIRSDILNRSAQNFVRLVMPDVAEIVVKDSCSHVLTGLLDTGKLQWQLFVKF